MEYDKKHDTAPHFRIRYFLSRVYDLLLYVYPSSFREEYGEPMAQLFRDETRESLLSGGLPELIGYLFHTLVDLIITITSEHMNKIIQTTKEEAMRWLALTFVSLILLYVIFGMVNPEAIFDLIDLILTPGGLIVVGALRIVFGVALIVAADASRAPVTMRVLGVITFIAGIITPFFNIAFFREVLGWWSGLDVAYIRIGLVLTLIIWSLILYALTPRRRFTPPHPEVV